MEWNIDKKLMTIVVDNVKNNEPMINHLKSWLNCKGALVYKGDLFHTRCTAHIINLIVKSGLKVINPLVEFIRNSCKFIGGSLAREQKWKIDLSQTRLNNKRNVEIDTDTR